MKSIKKVITSKIKTLYYRESMGWLRTLYREVGLPDRWLLHLFGFIILLCLYLIKPLRFVKLCTIRSIHIGQQAANTDLFLRHLQLEKGRKDNRILYIGISGKPDNQQLLKMFKRKLFIIQSQLALVILNRSILTKSVFSVTKFYEELPQTNVYYVFNNTEPDLYFTPAEEEEGRKLLSKMGIDDKSWFVCFHSRDPAFVSHLCLKRQYPGDFRNSDIKNKLEPAKYIASCGGFAVRMGYIVAEKLPDLNNARIIDYAFNYRTDFGDIYLAAKCKFFLGDTSGIMVVSMIFNVPIALVNLIPFAFSPPPRKGDLFIPKKIWSIEEKRFLTFREHIKFADSNIQADKKLAEGKYVVVENTAEEILDLAKEMNERLDGRFETTEEDEELQNRFRSLLQPTRLYSTPAWIGAKFLRQNKELLK